MPVACLSPWHREQHIIRRNVVLVCGGRDFDDSELLFTTMDDLHEQKPISLLIHGAAKGADSMAGEWAQARRIPFQAFPAGWETHKRAAGPIRNEQMLREGEPDLVVAFPGGRGTAHMVRIAKAAAVEVREIQPVSRTFDRHNPRIDADGTARISRRVLLTGIGSLVVACAFAVARSCGS